MTIQLTLTQIRNELWSSLSTLQCNWTTATDLDEYINRAARERSITLPATDPSDIRVIPILSEIYALEFLYNRAMNNVDVTMGGKRVELSQIVEHLKDKLDRLYGLLPDDVTGAGVIKALGGRVNMQYTPTPLPQKVDVRKSERYEG